MRTPKFRLRTVAPAIAVVLVSMQNQGMYSTRLMVPFFKRFRPDLSNL